VDTIVHRLKRVESDRSAEESYGHDTENTDSSAMPDGVERSDATVTFVHRNGATGELALVVVHDEPTDSSSGSAPMTFDGVSSDRSGLDRWLFVDGSDLENPVKLATFTDDTADVSARLFATDEE
jgi:hypothetical protein